MSVKNLGALLLLSALWGGSFLFMRIAVPALGPVLLIELRFLLAGLALLGYALLRRRVPPLRSHWRQYVVIGLVNCAIPPLLISFAELHLPASLAATLNATTALFTSLVAAVWMGEALTLRKTAALLIGFAGVVTLVGLGPLSLTAEALWSIGASLLASAFYGVAAVYTKVKVQGAQPEGLALYSQLFSALWLLPLVPFTLPAALPSMTVIISLLMLALLSTSLGFRLYFHLIVDAGPAKATMVTYLAPAFGMLWGALFLHETLSVGFLLGSLLILGSVAVLSPQRRTPSGRIHLT
ncbi:MAG TPA: DMT family transporter [Symbiobacteriaceae bacterium]|nr:DMT family transporter [Symbiobacteriaceae bacterium]